MTKYDRDSLRKVLAKHGYKPIIVTPEWSQFAVQILIAESLVKKSKK